MRQCRTSDAISLTFRAKNREGLCTSNAFVFYDQRGTFREQIKLETRFDCFFFFLFLILQTLEALKAIGNMGLETERLLKLLKECTDDVGGFLPMEIRVASIDAHRRMPSCEKTRDLYFLNYYRNFTLDTELRIASYLQVMRCLDYNVVKTIKHTLKLEEINQGIFLS